MNLAMSYSSYGSSGLRPPRSKYDTLERMLNRTTLSVQRVTHKHIIERGQLAFVQTTSEETYDKEKAVQIALDQAETRFARELKCALTRIRVEKEQERMEALKNQRQYYEKHMARVAEQRDQLEEEHLRELRRQFEIEKEEALREQESLLRKEAADALAEARVEERQSVRAELQDEHEKAIARAIQATEEAARARAAQEAQEMREACARESSAALDRQARCHADEVERLDQRYDHLLGQLERSVAYNRQVEKDFQHLQGEYKRFLDNTDGHFHSDYMMKMRRHGLQLASQGLPPLDLEDPGDLRRVARSADGKDWPQ